MKILITGGGGYIGSNLATSLLKDGHTVIIVDSFINSNWSGTAAMYDRLFSLGNNSPDNLSVVTCDLSNVHLYWKVEEHFAEADIIYHFASSVGVKAIDNNPRGAFTNMLNINSNILYLLQRYKKRVIFASTSEVYGNNSSARECDTLQIPAPTQLRWGYACNKLMFEFMYRSLDADCTIVRFFNITGGNHSVKSGMVLPVFLHNAMNNKPLVIHGDGSQFRSFCDIRDAVNMLILLLDNSHKNNIYNIGNDKNIISMSDLAKKVVHLTNSDSEILYIPREDCFSSNSGEIFKRSPCIDKIKQFYKPRHNVDKIILNMIDNYERV